MSGFTADALPVLIGSLPHSDHREAVDLIFSYTPQIPLWPQLPAHRDEGMLLQFLPGLPGIRKSGDKTYVACDDDEFEAEFLSFFEDYLAVSETGVVPDDSRFAMSTREAAGFFAFLEAARQHRQDELVALKGQLTGPVTFCTGLVDQDGRAIFYNEQMRDAAVKLLAFKAKWQTRKMAEVKEKPLVFFDEPGLAGFGSSAFITITPADIDACFAEVFAAVHEEGGLAGVHVCANTEWPIIFNSDVDVVSFDAFSYFDRIVLYPEQLAAFMRRGGILAFGIVPTTTEYIDAAEAGALADKWFEQAAALERLGIPRATIFSQTLITPSCGTGTISAARSVRVLELTRDVSRLIREKHS